ncbi:unnamed protein product, partial [Oikopleura dioica]
GRKAGKLFLNTNSAKARNHYKIAAKALNWAEAPTCHSLRAHYVVQALKAGANESDIVAVCRWKDEAMLNTYRMRQLECTKAGPAFKIFEKKDNAGVNIDLSTAQPGNSAKVEADIIDLSVEIQRPSKQEPTKARQQATIKIVRQTRTAATQTDQVYEARDQAIATPTLSPEAYESWELFLKKKRVK